MGDSLHPTPREVLVPACVLIHKMKGAFDPFWRDIDMAVLAERRCGYPEDFLLFNPRYKLFGHRVIVLSHLLKSKVWKLVDEVGFNT